MLKRVVILSMVLALVLVGAFSYQSTEAQDGAEVYADGLVSPRKMSFDNEGNLYVAEAGEGGTFISETGDGFGPTSRISVIDPEGNVDTVLSGLISYRPSNSLGAADVLVTEDSMWILIGEVADFSIPYSHALIEIDRDTNRIQRWIDLLAYELFNDPDGNPNEQSNPTDFEVAEDGTIYIANAGCNCLMTWTEADGLGVAVAWDFATDNPVPTSIEIGPDGDLYVGFLTGFPFPKEGSRIERWSGGELVETYPGLTAVSDVLVTEDGTIYAVEYGQEFSNASGWAQGRVVMVDADGVTPILSDLDAPFGLAQSADGTILVSVGSAGGDGQILIVE